MSRRYKTTDYFIENHEYSTNKIDKDDISILNWNIQKKNRSKHWSDDFKNIIDSYNPSILLLQECQFIKGIETLLHTEHYGSVFAPNFLDIFKNLHSGVLTASHSKYKIVTVIRSYAYEPLIKVPKIFLSTIYDVSGENGELLVLNIHAINFVGFWKFISQVQQLEYAIKSFSGPVILSGDFNTWNKKRANILDKILTEAGLFKVKFNECHTKNIKKFMFFNTLDHIYFRGLSITKKKVLKTASSDHNPLIVSFKLDL